MHVSDVLRHKGSEVVTVPPSTSVRTLLQVLAEHGIGAALVSDDGAALQGLISERDVVRGLVTSGPDLLDLPVSALMTTSLRTASPEDTVQRLMAEMTEHRVRHIPVLVDGLLVGVVSIGDLVKSRLDELESEQQQLVGYISSGG